MAENVRMVDRVRTTRGTNSRPRYSRGNTFPAVAVPHGFNFWTPVTDAGALDWIYTWDAPAIQAFAVSHQPSPWMGDRHTFQFLPGTGPLRTGRRARGLGFTHEAETARPHHYGVRCGNGIAVDIAPTGHAAIVRIAYPEPGWLLFDNVDNRGSIRIDTERGVVTATTRVRSRHSAGARTMYVHAEVDVPAVRGGRVLRCTRPLVTGWLGFDATEVTLRIATSLISPGQARRNLELEIPPGTRFEDVREAAAAEWEELLGRFEIEGATEDQRTTFYSNLYRLFLYPNIAHEQTPDGVRHVSPVLPGTVMDGEMYVNNGFWDTYRTCWPAYALFTPRRCGEMIDGFVRQYHHGGWIARWSSPGYADLMNGTSSDVAFADAHSKGVRNFDIDGAYLAALKNATVTPPGTAVGRKGMDRSGFLGYTPLEVREGLSWALEGCINDFGLANMATALGRHDEAAYFAQRCRHYANLWDEETGFFRGRRADGTWRSPASRFDPEVWGGDYTETDAWNMVFSVPHDGPGLVALHGGPAALEEKLDLFFATPEIATKRGSYGTVIHEMVEARDIGMGQYGHSNQPSHHIPFIYLYAGAPAKTQRVVRDVLLNLYHAGDNGNGYCGDEDNGEMSTWYTFAALGIYPLAVGSPVYAIAAPLFERAVVRLENGNDLVVNAPGNSPENCYVRALSVNGEPYHDTTITHDLLTGGAVLDFDLVAEPADWGTKPVVPQRPRPLSDLAGTGAPAELFDNTTRTDAVFRTSCPVIEFTVAADGAHELVMYTLTSGSRPGDPRAWVLEGSADGTAWTALDERTGEIFRWRRQTRPFLLPSPASYPHYRLRITASDTHRPRLSQWELLARRE